jgi:hypothetical protein
MTDLKYKRFFAFGCSYTHFVWPTWAEIIADDLDIPFENWGMSGSGNQSIQTRLVECELKNELTPEDLVIISWSTWSREDRYLENHWKCGGNIFNNPFYDDVFVKKYWSWENDILRNATTIHSTYKAYKDIISYQMSLIGYPKIAGQGEMIPLFLRKLLGLNPESRTESLENFFETKIHMPDTIVYSHDKNSKFNGSCMDGHPDIKSHLYIVEKQIYPKLGLTLKQTTKDKYITMFNRIAAVLKPNDEYDFMVDKVNRVMVNMGVDLEKHNRHYGF